MLNLLIDIGNTRIKWGFFIGDRCQLKGFVPTRAILSLTGELLHALQELQASPSSLEDVFVDQVLACSVAGESLNQVLEASLPAGLAARLQWFKSGELTQCGLLNRYQIRTRLGADRWASAIGAWHRVAVSCLVVTAGTATTIDLIKVLQKNEAGATAEFAGGVILPGLSLMQDSLAHNTAQLPSANGQMTEWPRNTDDAISTGCLEAQLGAIERLHRRLPASAPIVLSGGAAPLLSPWLGDAVLLIDDLVLQGLAVVAAILPPLYSQPFVARE